MRDVIINRFAGMADDVAETRIPDNGFVSLLNIRPLKHILEKIDGYEKFNEEDIYGEDQMLQPVRGLMQLNHTSGSQDIYAFLTDRIMKRNTETEAFDDFATLSDYGLNNMASDSKFCVYQDKIFVADRNNQPYFLAGQAYTGLVKEKVIAEIRLSNNDFIDLVNPSTHEFYGDRVEGVNSFDVSSADGGELEFLCQRGDLVYIKKQRSLIIFDKNQNKVLVSRIYPENSLGIYRFMPAENDLWFQNGLKLYPLDYTSLGYKTNYEPGGSSEISINQAYTNFAIDSTKIYLYTTSEAAPNFILNYAAIDCAAYTVDEDFSKWKILMNKLGYANIGIFYTDAGSTQVNNSPCLYNDYKFSHSHLRLLKNSSGTTIYILNDVLYEDGYWIGATWYPQRYIEFYAWDTSAVGRTIALTANDYYATQIAAGYEDIEDDDENRYYFYRESIVEGNIAYTAMSKDISIEDDMKIFHVGAPPKIIPYIESEGLLEGRYTFTQSYVTLLGESKESPASDEIDLSAAASFRLYFGALPSNYPYDITQRFIYAYNVDTGVKTLLDTITDEDAYDEGYDAITSVGVASVPKYNLLPKCSFVFKHLDKLVWGGDPETPNVLYASEAYYPEVYTTDGTRPIQHNDGDKLINGMSIYDRAYLYKERNIYVVIGEILTGQVLKVEEGRGLLASRSLVLVGTTAYYLSSVGICKLYQDKVTSLSDGLIDLSGYTEDELSSAFADYDEENNEYRLYIADKILKYNIDNDAFYYDDKVDFPYEASGVVMLEGKKRVLFANNRYIYLENEGGFFDTSKRWCMLTSKQYNVGDNYTRMMLALFHLDAELNSDLMVYGDKGAFKIAPEYEQYYDLRPKSFFGKNVQFNMFERSLYPMEINSVNMEVM